MIQAKDIMRVTGLTYRQIQYWDGKIVEENESLSRCRSFYLSDLMIYSATARLKQLGISLQKIRKNYLDDIKYIILDDQEFGSGSQIVLIGNTLFHLRGSLTTPRNPGNPSYSLVVDYHECIDKLGLGAIK